MEENITTYWYIAEADSNGSHTLKDPQCEGLHSSLSTEYSSIVMNQKVTFGKDLTIKHIPREQQYNTSMHAHMSINNYSKQKNIK